MAEFMTVGPLVTLFTTWWMDQEVESQASRGLGFNLQSPTSWAGETARPFKALATTPGDLSVISKNHVRGEENQFAQVVL